MMFLALIAPPLYASTLPLGVPVDEAVVAGVTSEGLDLVTLLIPDLVPTSIPVDDLSESVDLWVCEPGFWLGDMEVNLEVVNTQLTPGNGTLDLSIQIDVAINSAADPFDMELDYCLGSTDCPGYVEPFAVDIDASMALQLVDTEDGPTLDVTIGQMDIGYDLDPSEDLKLDCGIQTLEDVLNYLGISIYDLMLGIIEDSIGDIVGDFEDQLDELIGESFSELAISEEVDLLGATMQLELYPSDIIIKDSGIEVIVGGSFDVPADDCVEAYDPGGSALSGDPVPVPGAGGQISLRLNSDWLNQGLYAAWRSGILCQELDELEGLTLDTSTLSLLAGDAFEDLFEEAAPIRVVTRPEGIPTATFGGEHHINIGIEDLGVEIQTMIDGRQARLLSMNLDALAGADMEFDGTVGEIGVALDLGADSFETSIGYNEFAPDSSDAILSNFDSFFGSTLSPLLDGLIGDIGSFALPTLEGFGFTGFDIGQASGTDAWLEMRGTVGLATYEATGCDESSSSCDGGCASGGSARLGTWMLPLLLAAWRRRRA